MQMLYIGLDLAQEKGTQTTTVMRVCAYTFKNMHYAYLAPPETQRDKLADFYPTDHEMPGDPLWLCVCVLRTGTNGDVLKIVSRTPNI